MTADDISRALGRLEAGLTGLRQSVETITEAHEGRLADHEKRVRFLERWVWSVGGAGVLLGAIAGYVMGR